MRLKYLLKPSKISAKMVIILFFWRMILALDFLSFDGRIVLQNCLLTLFLAIVAFLVPILRIRYLDPVRILQAEK